MLLKKTLAHVVALGLVAAALLAPAAARAQFSTTDVQFLYGQNFHDNLLGYDSKSGAMSTVTVENFSTFTYGDSFFFMDMYRLNATGGYKGDIYGEWHPRLFLDKLGLPTGGPIKHWGLAGEINQSRGFYAYLGGLGLDLDIPFFTVAGLNVYFRKDHIDLPAISVEIDTNTWQVSPFWTVPITAGPVRLVFTGFVDVTTNHSKAIDVMAQPQLLLDVSHFWGATNRILIGCEWYVHSYRNPDPTKNERKTVSAPQAMVQWVIL